jgi:parvulin-like peptidyl-prolyl isomerase
LADVDSASKMRLLNQIVDRRRKIAVAYDMGLDDEEPVLNAVDNQKEKITFSKYFENMVVDSVIDLAKVEEHLEQIKTEIKANHILIKFQDASGAKDGRTKEEAEKLAQSLYERIKNGESIDLLAKEYSEDPSAKQNMGDLGYFTWGKMVDQFQKVAFNMEPGEVSEPVLSQFGYHVIQVKDRRENPRYDPNNLGAATYQIKSKLWANVRSEGMKIWEKRSNRLRKESNFMILEENLANLAAITEEKKGPERIEIDDYTDEEKDMVLAEFDGGQIVLNDLFDNYRKSFGALIGKLTDPEKLKPELENIVIYDIVAKITERENYDQNPEIQKALKQTTEQQMLSLLDKKVVEDLPEIIEDSVRAYYEDNRDQYKREAQIEIWEIYVTDENTAKKVARLANAGQDFEGLAEKYNEDRGTKKKKGYLGYRAKRRRGAVSQKAFEIGPEKIAGPIKYRKGWAILKTGGIKPEGIKEFDEVKNQARQRLKSQKIKQLREEWEKEIKEEFQAKINYELLESI